MVNNNSYAAAKYRIPPSSTVVNTKHFYVFITKTRKKKKHKKNNFLSTHEKHVNADGRSEQISNVFFFSFFNESFRVRNGRRNVCVVSARRPRTYPYGFTPATARGDGQYRAGEGGIFFIIIMFFFFFERHKKYKKRPSERINKIPTRWLIFYTIV